MTAELFEKHEDLLKRAVAAVRSREFWNPYPESPRAYADGAPQAGEEAFADRLGKRFGIDQAAPVLSAGEENSPYGTDLGIGYPATPPPDLIRSATDAAAGWAGAAVEERIGVCLEILAELRNVSFEMAHAVMQTTGQPFLLAFQSGGSHALARGLEAVAQAYLAMRRMPRRTVKWEKPQGRRDPLQLEKRWLIRPRGIAVTLGSATSPNLNAYAGIFASLATGNSVIVKPDPTTILPLALLVETARRVLGEAGYSPDVVLLAVDQPGESTTEELITDPAVRIVDASGDPEVTEWAERNATQATVYTTKRAVNSVVLDAAKDLKGVIRELSVSLTMYSGQMATTPQNVFVPADGISAGEERASFDAIASGLASAVEDLLSDPQRAGDILGAIKVGDFEAGIAAAAAAGEVLLESRRVAHPNFAAARVVTPTIIRTDSSEREIFCQEFRGPVVFVVATSGTGESLELAGEAAAKSGSVTWLVYADDDVVIDRTIEAALHAGVSAVFNLPVGLYVNHPAPFSDYYVSGINPSGNTVQTDASFVSGRFSVVGISRST